MCIRDSNDPHHHSSWFSPERGVEKWYDPNAKTLSAAPDAQHTDLAVQIGFAARFDLVVDYTPSL